MSAEQHAIALDVDAQLAGELGTLAGERGISVPELTVDLVVTALRSGVQRDCPTFTVDAALEPQFVAFGFRPVERRDGITRMCPYHGVSFADASDALASALERVPERDLANIL